MGKHKILTLDDLYNFYFSQNKSVTFNSNDDNDNIVVQTNGSMSFKKDDYDPKQDLLSVHLKSCHLLENRNGSFISKESMEQAIPSFCNRPILGYIHQLDDGSWDFAGHEMEIDDDGNTKYLEIPVGNIPESCNAKLVYDSTMDKTYLELDGYIYEGYTKAADILRGKEESKVSVELAIEELSYDAKNKVLNLDKFHFNGVTILGRESDGTEIGEGMLGSNITLNDFKGENNSFFSKKIESKTDEIKETLDNIISILCSIKEGGNCKDMKFDELLKKYNKTKEDIDFDFENMSDEELEEKFAELFETEENEDTDVDTDADDETNEDESNESDETSGNEDEDTATTDEFKKKYSVELEDGTVKTFELFLDDIQNALYKLVNNTYANDDAWYSVKVSIENNYVIMTDWCSDKAYKQTFKIDGTDYILTGDREEVFSHYLTVSEEQALEDMRSNYSELKKFKEDTENAEMHSKREAILSDEKFKLLEDVEAFQELSKNMDNYSLEDLAKEAKSILVDSGKFNFSTNKDETTASHKAVGLLGNDTSISNKDNPYPGFFEDEK